MQDTLINKLHAYIRQNNPDMLMALEEESSVTKYLTDKTSAVDSIAAQLQSEGNPPYIIETICMEILTEDLRPSRFNYICTVLEEDFENTYQQLQSSGALIPEAINMMGECKPVFEQVGFKEENENSRQLRYAITGTISEYLNKQM